MYLRLFFLLTSLAALPSVTLAQTAAYQTEKRVNRKMTINEYSLLYDKETGRRLSFEEFVSLLNQTPRLYTAVPEVDETGKPAYYVLRKRTPQELEAGHPFMANDHKKPEIGQPLPAFVMEGADGKTYRSDKLRGRYVLLSFWNALEKPYLIEQHLQELTALADIARERKVKFVSLGTTGASREECLKATKEFDLGFVPIPESTGFKNRYGMFLSPSYMLIGPEGTLLAMVEKETVKTLEKYLIR